MDKILGLGNALVDVLATLENDDILKKMKLPKGSMQLINEEKLMEINHCFASMNTYMATGGSAGNTIRALSNLGASTGFIGKIGQDSYGEFYKEDCQRNGIEEKLQICELPSGVASTFITPDGERTFGTFLGAAAALKADDLILEMFKGYAYFYVEGYLVQDHDMILRAIELAKEAGLQICLDMASYNIVKEDINFFNLLIKKYVDILFANEEEAKAFTGQQPEKALDILSEMCSIAIVKIGEKGSLIKKGTEKMHVEALRVAHVVDTTGAGDYFAAGFLYGLTSGYSLDKCAKIGSILSGYVIQVIGTTLPAAQWDEIKLNITEMLSE